MKPCRGYTKNQVPCTKWALPGSRYCFFHQDPGTWVLGTLFGILLALIQTWYQGASPQIDVRCNPTANEEASRLECHISNSGRAEARDVIIGFNHSLPLETKLLADAELGISIVETLYPPDPEAHPISAGTELAFSVKVPRVAPRDKVSFQVHTVHEDNRRAAEQLMRIRTIQKDILKDFTAKLVTKFPDKAKEWNLEALLTSHAIDGNFFKPGKYSYEQGRYPVYLHSEDQERAKARDDELYKEFKPLLIEAWKDRPSFLAPVVRIRTSEGNRTYAIFPADVRTCMNMLVKPSELLKSGKLELYPPVPANYDEKNACT